jgi:hypothetical protein
MPQTGFEKGARHAGGYYRRRSTDIRDQPEVARRQSQVWRSTTPQGAQAVRRGALGCALGRWLESRQALSVAFVSLQVVGPRRLYRRRYDYYRCSRNGGCRC